MRLADAVLVIADVSGYTSFIKHRAVSLLHAEAIVTELIESVIDRAMHPLTLNKLEGDAALLYAETGGDVAAAMADAVGQVAGFFEAFDRSLAGVRDARRHCSCDACTNVDSLRLKAFVHVGEIAIKQVRQFEELAGEPVILIHRLLKNHVPSHEYVLLSDAAHAAIQSAAPECEPLAEDIDGLGPVTVWWLPPRTPSLRRLAASAIKAAAPPKAASEPILARSRFANLPRYRVGKLAEVWDHLAIVAGRLFRT
jgi:hypothetical protein